MSSNPCINDVFLLAHCLTSLRNCVVPGPLWGVLSPTLHSGLWRAMVVLGATTEPYSQQGFVPFWLGLGVEERFYYGNACMFQKHLRL
jgi:hypothetical protein